MIDLFYQHRVDPDVPIEDVAGAVASWCGGQGPPLRAVRGRRRRRSAAPTPCIPSRRVQSEYSLWTRDPEPEVLPTLAELGIGFVPFSPLGKGFLTGTVTASTSSAPATSARRSRGSPPRTAPPTRHWSTQVARPRRGQGLHARPDRARLAAGPAAVDRADPRHPPARPSRRERRGDRSRAVCRRGVRARCPRGTRRRPRRSLQPGRNGHGRTVATGPFGGVVSSAVLARVAELANTRQQRLAAHIRMANHDSRLDWAMLCPGRTLLSSDPASFNALRSLHAWIRRLRVIEGIRRRGATSRVG